MGYIKKALTIQKFSDVYFKIISNRELYHLSNDPMYGKFKSQCRQRPELAPLFSDCQV